MFLQQNTISANSILLLQMCVITRHERITSLF